MARASDHVVIVGAGLAGLSCALRLFAAGIPFTVFDASDRPGGRIRTDEVNGFKLDRGFQVLLTAYPAASDVLDYAALDLHAFYPGAYVRTSGTFHVMADPFRNLADGIRTFVNPIGSVEDKARIAQLRHRVRSGSLDEIWSRPETTSLNYLRQAGFSPSIIDGFFRPFFGGVFCEPDLRTSSKMLEFLFRMFSDGDIAIPAAGMEAIPAQLAGRLPDGAIQLNTRVVEIGDGNVRLEGGGVVDAAAVVVAADANATATLLPEVSSPGTFGTACLYYAAEHPPIREAALLLDSEPSGPVNHATVISNVSPLYAPPGAALISASTVGIPDMDDHQLDAGVRDQLRGWWGDQADRWDLLRIYRIPDALPRQEPPSLANPRRPIPVRARIYVCGDHWDNASINGALASGRRAADAVVVDLQGA